MDPQIRKRLRKPVNLLRCISRNGYGDKVFASPVEHRCYREGKISVVRSLSGEEVTSSLRLYFGEIFEISGDDVFSFGPSEEYSVLAFATYEGLKEGTGTMVVYL